LVELYTLQIVTIHDTSLCIFVLRYIMTQYIVTLLLERLTYVHVFELFLWTFWTSTFQFDKIKNEFDINFPFQP